VTLGAPGKIGGQHVDALDVLVRVQMTAEMSGITSATVVVRRVRLAER
jgi:hypothetical protein